MSIFLSSWKSASSRTSSAFKPSRQEPSSRRAINRLLRLRQNSTEPMRAE